MKLETSVDEWFSSIFSQRQQILISFLKRARQKHDKSVALPELDELIKRLSKLAEDPNE
jgi:hypothetical protein